MMTTSVRLRCTSAADLADLAEPFHEFVDGEIWENAAGLQAVLYLDGTPSVAEVRRAIASLEERLELRCEAVVMDLVDASEIASRLGRTRQAVSLWVNGSRGDSFPHPHDVIGRTKVWRWREVARWAISRGELDSDEPVELDDVTYSRLNAFLYGRRTDVRDATRDETARSSVSAAG